MTRCSGILIELGYVACLLADITRMIAPTLDIRYQVDIQIVFGWWGLYVSIYMGLSLIIEMLLSIYVGMLIIQSD